jgi:multiple antibiotic resistance protein
LCIGLFYSFAYFLYFCNRKSSINMSDTLSFGLLCFTSFFILINPISTMPVFMTMTATLNERDRTRIARKASIIGFIIIIVFAITGQLLFKFFGISIDSFRVVGGIIFFIMGMDMLQARLGQVKIKDSEVMSYVNDISITPLAIPMICGPGAISNAIILMQDANSAAKITILFLSITLVMLITFLIFYSSSRIIKFLGQTGINVMMRLMGLIVMVIAVEFFFSGLKPILKNILK